MFSMKRLVNIQVLVTGQLLYILNQMIQIIVKHGILHCISAEKVKNVRLREVMLNVYKY